MQYSQYGKNGPRISRLGFGVMRLPSRKKGNWGSVNFTRSVAVMRAALEAGVNFFDSHHQYHNGLSEVALGMALKGWKGQRVYIQTKTPMYNEEPLAWHKEKTVEALEKTGANCIDFLFFHSMSMPSFKKRGKDFFKLTDWAIKKGYVIQRGFSSHDSPKNIKAFIDTGEFSAMLLSYNLLNPEMRDVIAYAADKGMGVTVMNPVAGGSLAANTKQILKLLPGAKTGPEVALRYVLDTPGVTAAFSGMNTLEQVAENVRIAAKKIVITKKQRQVMKAGLKKFKTQSMSLCTACGYCMPCPSGVDIPLNFVQLNHARLLGLTDAAAAHINALKAQKSSAFACTQCGQCLEKCPNKIPIIENLVEVTKLVNSHKQ